MEGKKTVKVKTEERDRFSYRNPKGQKLPAFGEESYQTGTYNMMDESRAPVVRAVALACALLADWLRGRSFLTPRLACTRPPSLLLAAVAGGGR